MKHESKQMVSKSILKANNKGQKSKVRKCHQSELADGALGGEVQS